MVASLIRVRDAQLIIRHSITLSKQNAAAASNEHGPNEVASFAECFKIRMNATCYFCVGHSLTECRPVQQNHRCD